MGVGGNTVNHGEEKAEVLIVFFAPWAGQQVGKQNEAAIIQGEMIGLIGLLCQLNTHESMGLVGSSQGCWGSCWKGSPSHFLSFTWLTRDVPDWRWHPSTRRTRICGTIGQSAWPWWQERIQKQIITTGLQIPGNRGFQCRDSSFNTVSILLPRTVQNPIFTKIPLHLSKD